MDGHNIPPWSAGILGASLQLHTSSLSSLSHSAAITSGTLQLVHRLALVLLNGARHGRPKVLKQIQVGRIGLEVELGHAECAQLLGHEAGGELLVVVVQQVPLLRIIYQ